MIAFADDLLGAGGALSRELDDHRKIMAERYPELLMKAKATGHDGVWNPSEDASRESRRATPRSSGMRLVIASDTHEQHAGLVVPDGDVFIHCGDLTYRGDLQAIANAGKWIRSLPHRHKIVIAGNHDWAFELKLDAARSRLGDGEDGLVYLQDFGVTIDGVSFWGSPWQPWFFDWAFNLRRGAALTAKWALIPDSTDVLITHGPPMGVLDFVPRGEHVGCADLLSRIAILKPKVHAFGHIHEGAGVLDQDGITYVNASICDGEYRPVNPVRVVDL
jgi:predicted phosphodiesterase